MAITTRAYRAEAHRRGLPEQNHIWQINELLMRDDSQAQMSIGARVTHMGMSDSTVPDYRINHDMNETRADAKMQKAAYGQTAVTYDSGHWQNGSGRHNILVDALNEEYPDGCLSKNVELNISESQLSADVCQHYSNDLEVRAIFSYMGSDFSRPIALPVDPDNPILHDFIKFTATYRTTKRSGTSEIGQKRGLATISQLVALGAPVSAMELERHNGKYRLWIERDSFNNARSIGAYCNGQILRLPNSDCEIIVSDQYGPSLYQLRKRSQTDTPTVVISGVLRGVRELEKSFRAHQLKNHGWDDFRSLVVGQK